MLAAVIATVAIATVIENGSDVKAWVEAAMIVGGFGIVVIRTMRRALASEIARQINGKLDTLADQHRAMKQDLAEVKLALGLPRRPPPPPPT